VTLLLSAASAIYAYGRNVQAMTTMTATLTELRSSVANLLARLGEAEGDIKAILRGQDVEREFSGRVRP
jgi:hypothetical protein